MHVILWKWFPERRSDVLPAMAFTRVINPKTCESSVSANTRHVHGFIPNWIFPGKKTVHDMQFNIPNSSISDLLQWIWKLFILGKLLWEREGLTVAVYHLISLSVVCSGITIVMLIIYTTELWNLISICKYLLLFSRLSVLQTDYNGCKVLCTVIISAYAFM